MTVPENSIVLILVFIFQIFSNNDIINKIQKFNILFFLKNHDNTIINQKYITNFN